MKAEHIGEAVGIGAMLAYLLGIPVSFGVMTAWGLGAGALFFSIIWPVAGLAYLGYWVAA